MRPPILNPLFADVTTLPGVGPKLALLVARAAGPRVIDLILTLPTGVIDRSARPKIADAPFGALATLEVHVDKHDPPRSPRLPYRVICSDETGFITLIFFRGKPDYLNRALPEGETRLISGKIEEYAGARQMTHPDHIADPKDPDAMPLFEAVY
ncbi:MAG: ATP-dependent DNA helicase RecG, partial [Amphiplicatus sp.]|nr:ATP-dependent DNA helicase RecG [Amphiplicatus sp.]